MSTASVTGSSVRRGRRAACGRTEGVWEALRQAMCAVFWIGNSEKFIINFLQIRICCVDKMDKNNVHVLIKTSKNIL